MDKNERNCQIRMPASLWNLIGEIAQDLGYKDARGRHSAVIRGMIAAAAAKWMHSPYVCRSSQHTVYVTRDGSLFYRDVDVLRLNSPRERLPCFVEMKPEKRQYYHKRYWELRDRGEHEGREEHDWFLDRWLMNHFAVWTGKKEADELETFEQRPLSADVDNIGTTYKSADLSVHAAGGRFLTREAVGGLIDYVQWKGPGTPFFDYVAVPIDIPTRNLEICVVIEEALFENMDIEEIPNLSLEFRNRESARFEGKEAGLYEENRIVEQWGRSSEDEGADDMLRRIRRLRQRIFAVMEGRASDGREVATAARIAAIRSSLSLPQSFLFYQLRWPSPHLGIEACVRWEKPVQKNS